MLNSNIFSTCLYNMANFDPLTTEIGPEVCGTPAISNGFRVLPLLLQRRSPEANRTLNDVWPSPAGAGSLYMHFRGLLPPDGILPGAKFTLRPSLAFSYIGTVTVGYTALEHRASAKLCGVVQGIELRNFRRGCHLLGAARPSRWAHIVAFSERVARPSVCRLSSVCL